MNTKNLEHYVEQTNRWSRFGKRPLSLLNAEDRQVIADRLDGDLSPERLSCDGELPAAEVRKRYAYLTRVARELLSVDPSVTMYEFG